MRIDFHKDEPNGVQLEIGDTGVMLTISQHEDGYIHGSIALAPASGNAVDFVIGAFHTAPGQQWHTHKWMPLAEYIASEEEGQSIGRAH